jgi:triacylglycerol esterase/lipase EstA (alpha/beta hydrolase family)
VPVRPTMYGRIVNMRARLALGGLGVRAAIAAITSLTLCGLVAPADAGAALAYAPLDQPGPPLSIPQDKLDASLNCTPGVQNASREPVLLNPATGATPEQNFSWNYEKAFNNLGIPWCAYTAPYSTLGDIQDSGEYLVYNIRKMYAMAGRRIAIVGHSQGGMSMRWPFRFWPDTRSMVDDVIGFSGPNHGTTQRSTCSDCPPAIWQQYDVANFIKAINSYTETFAGISYTEVYTHTDEVVQPANDNQHASAALHIGDGQITNVATQDICPLDTQEHNMIGTNDPVAYALAIDALTHPGPADPSRISPSVCTQPSMPGVNPTDLNMWLQIASVGPGQLAVATPVNLVGVPTTRKEPPLKCYVFANCSGANALKLRVSAKPRHPRPGRRVKLRIRVWAREGSRRVVVHGARVKIGRHKIRRLTNRRGLVKVRRRLGRHHTYRIRAFRTGTAPGLTKVRTRRHR